MIMFRYTEYRCPVCSQGFRFYDDYNSHCWKHKMDGDRPW